MCSMSLEKNVYSTVLCLGVKTRRVVLFLRSISFLQFFLVVANGGYFLLAVHRLLIAVASLIEEHRLRL